jgi:hypothetical protein
MRLEFVYLSSGISVGWPTRLARVVTDLGTSLMSEQGLDRHVDIQGAGNKGQVLASRIHYGTFNTPQMFQKFAQAARKPMPRLNILPRPLAWRTARH